MKTKPLSLPSLSGSPFARNGHSNGQLHPSLELNPKVKKTAAVATGVLAQALQDLNKMDPSKLSVSQRLSLRAITGLDNFYGSKLFLDVASPQGDKNDKPETSPSQGKKSQAPASVIETKGNSIGTGRGLLRLCGLEDFTVERFDIEGELKKLQRFFGISDAAVPKVSENDPKLFEKGAGGAYSLKNHALKVFTHEDAVTSAILGSIPAAFGSQHQSFHRLAFFVPAPVKKFMLMIFNKGGLFKSTLAHEYTHSTQGVQIRKLPQSEIEEIVRWYIEKLDPKVKKILLSDENIKKTEGSFSSDEAKLLKYYMTDLFSDFPKERKEPISEEELATSKYLLLSLLEAGLLGLPKIRNSSEGLLRYALNQDEMEARLGAGAYMFLDNLGSKDQQEDLNPGTIRAAQCFLYEVAVNDQLLKIDEMKRNGALEKEVNEEENKLKEFISKEGLLNMNLSSVLFTMSKNLETKENQADRFAFIDRWIDKAKVVEKKISGSLASLETSFVNLLPQAFQKRLSG